MFFAKKNPVSAFVVFAVFALAFCLMGGVLAEPAHADTEGWKLIKNNKKLVYIQQSGEKAVSTNIDGITLGADGYAKSNTASKLKIAVMKKIKKLTKPSMSREKKMLACAKWVRKTQYNNVEPYDYGKRGWAQRAALKVLNTGYSECTSAACALAMFAYELGYKPKVCVKLHDHAICMVGKRALDDLRDGWFNYGPHWPWQPWKEWKVLSYSDTDPQGSTTLPVGLRGKSGLTKYKGHYYYVSGSSLAISKWKKISGKKYYFDAKGRALTGPQQVNGKWYVFSAKGKLLTGKKTREVKVSGARYLVKKDGCAAKGWNSAHTRYFLISGAQAKGLCCVGGKVAFFGSAGTYDSAKTAQLQKLTQLGGRAEDLIKALAAIETPRVENLGSSCYPLAAEMGLTGTDRRYMYSHLTLEIFVAEDGRLFLESISAR